MLMPASACPSAPAGAAPAGTAASTSGARPSPPSTPVNAPAGAQQAAPVGGSGAHFAPLQQLPCLPMPVTTPAGAPEPVTAAQQPATAGPSISEAFLAPPGAFMRGSATCHSQHLACCVCGACGGAFCSSKGAPAEVPPVCYPQHLVCLPVRWSKEPSWQQCSCQVGNPLPQRRASCLDHSSCTVKHWPPVWRIMQPFPASAEQTGGCVTASEHETTLQGLLLCYAPAMLGVALPPLPSRKNGSIGGSQPASARVNEMDMESSLCQFCRQCGHRGS